MVYFLIYLFLEVFVSFSISSQIGFLATFLEIVFSAFLGFFILLNFKSTLRENFTSLYKNSIDIGEFQRLNLFTLIGAILLILPGFLTDIIGILLQFSVFTNIIINRYSIKSHNQKNYKEKTDDVIDVEVISDSSSTR